MEEISNIIYYPFNGKSSIQYWISHNQAHRCSFRINNQNSILDYPVFTQNYNSLIRMSKRWNKYPTSYVIFPLVNHQLNIKEVTRDSAEILCYFLQFYGMLIQCIIIHQ